MSEAVRVGIRVQGIVQGVGFRPFVYSLAAGLGCCGFVGNDVEGVFIELEGERSRIEEFLWRLRDEDGDDTPPLAEITDVTVREKEPLGETGFRIVASDSIGAKRTLVSADAATCDDCLAELTDPADRRYRYPFINCTNCGPRFTIVADVPYDRANTTMVGFPMCAACAAEYHDPTDRRFHAQPVCCPDCGPTLRITGSDGGPLATSSNDAVTETARLIDQGHSVAIKGLGGYHLAADATSEPAAARLRAAKRREDKPFAVMLRSVRDAADYCHIDETAARLLSGRRRPIVLADKRPGSSLASSVAPGNRALGVMLPYTPMHHLLLQACSGPIVLTSGNISDEPIAYRDEDAFDRLRGIADAFLTHDRGIRTRTDDSVTRSWRGREMLTRRSRGYAPEPVTLPWAFPRPVLACGAELKNTFCLGTGRRAVVSHHIGDLENYETLRSFTEGIEHLSRLFDVTPEVLAHDMHPEYLATKYAQGREGIELCPVQHHHAHIASCLADNGEAGPVIGVAFDGTGFGANGTIWGGEFLLADLTGFRRAGHFADVPLPGGAAAIRAPWRMAVSYLHAAYGEEFPTGLDLLVRHETDWPPVAQLARRGVNAPPTSSAGRLFDAAAALLGVRDEITYEGQAAIELEQLADPSETGGYPVGLRAGAPLQLAGVDLVRALVEDSLAGVPAPVIAGRFHNGVADAVVSVCERLRSGSGLDTVALSGGVFGNLLLLGRCQERLAAEGFRVLIHSRVPTNDGGISLGQAAVAGACDRACSA
jgi:hydrogenase maturation protein HypF